MEDIEVQFITISNDRIDCVRDTITLDGKEFSFRFSGFRSYPKTCVFDRIVSQRAVQQIAQYGNEMLKHAPDADSPKNILNALNDDWLITIFEQLNLHDLCDVANVCKRFNGIAMKVFETKYKDADLIRILREARTARKIAPLSLSRIGL